MSSALGRLLRPTALTLTALVLVAGCGSSSDSEATGEETSPSPSATSPSGSPSDSTSASPSPEADQATVVAITVADGAATPQGKQLEVGVDEPVVLRVESDAPGELHIHSTPEQEVSFEAGTTEQRLRFDRPGVVDIESHDLDQLLVRLEVR